MFGPRWKGISGARPMRVQSGGARARESFLRAWGPCPISAQNFICINSEYVHLFIEYKQIRTIKHDFPLRLEKTNKNLTLKINQFFIKKSSYFFTPQLGTGPENKAKIFLPDYQGDYHDLYVTFDAGSDFQSFEAVSCTGIEKTG